MYFFGRVSGELPLRGPIQVHNPSSNNSKQQHFLHFIHLLPLVQLNGDIFRPLLRRAVLQTTAVRNWLNNYVD